MPTLVFGHKSPDTDSTGSPIIWAWYLSEMKGRAAEPRLLGEPNSEAAFMLERWNLDKPEIIHDVGPEDDVIVVDTNNVAELPEHINEANLVEVIDHHLVQGGLKTRAPIPVTIRPLACTATVMHQLMGDDAAKMPDQIKGAMLSCILSDTLEFRSPTTTDLDRELAERLAAELDLAIPAYASEMFAAKSDVSAFSAEELLRLDSKEYELGDTKLRISVLETTSPETVLERQADLLAAIPKVAEADGVDEVMLFIVDILKEEATLLVPNDRVRTIAEASFDTVCGEETAILPGIVSRKKQIIPNLKT